MQSDPYLGEIRLFALNFMPTGWAECNGQILSIVQNQALFSLLGTNYGGDGRNTFALPDLRGRVPLMAAANDGTLPASVPAARLGDAGGEESVTLTLSQVAHTHSLSFDGGAPAGNSPVMALPAASQVRGMRYASSANATMNPAAVMNNQMAGNYPHSNLQPLLVLRFGIALTGSFPVRA